MCPNPLLYGLVGFYKEGQVLIKPDCQWGGGNAGELDEHRLAPRRELGQDLAHAGDERDRVLFDVVDRGRLLVSFSASGDNEVEAVGDAVLHQHGQC